ncbi:DEAD/DEAH box helicase [Brevirhabdus pacifica]|uniref:DEAD/DEAH box helicase n=1 Tax=Brevirhabdus pacifica TaxID=1267768 RepID=A0A1U7DK56_9RHOB|nr:DEAD/DEAH box helicase [Brevirhabdus pacifica]OWU78600.1 DEAD/DEAH box helicase [Loktanella sp. 22II-4b]PJJ80826.1 helicase-like protein [Brevirhabdus pacifica]
MFDDSSRRLLRSAPDLPGLDADTLDQFLTAAHMELATIRARATDGEGAFTIPMLDRVRRLATTFEAYVALNLRPEQTSATAFVAASAYQIISQATTRPNTAPTSLTSDAVGASLSSTLLFLIADRAADASEAALQLRARGEPRATRRSLILSIREFARGDLLAVTERDLDSDWIPDEDTREDAADYLFRECAYALQTLASEALGGIKERELVEHRLLKVISLADTKEVTLPSEFDIIVQEQFAGPHHLATLLLRLLPRTRATMLVNTTPPKGADPTSWKQWVLSQSQTRPFLWTNHLKAVGTGYLSRGNSMVMTSPTGSGKTTLSILKIAATLCAGESVVYLAPTHALVDQVEADLTGEVGNLEPTSVEETSLDELGDRLPPLSVMTPERCLALLGSAPELFDKVGLLVFDEFHLIGTDDPKRTSKINPRAIDAMLSLLSFMANRPDADLLLLSAMVSNGEEISKWLNSFGDKAAKYFNDPWKPTRQLRSCVIYDDAEVRHAMANADKAETKSGRKHLPVKPYGLFSLVSGWHPQNPEKLAVRRLTEQAPPLTRSQSGYPTSNRNIVASQIAAEFAASGKRVIVFCQDTRGCSSVASAIDDLLEPAKVDLDEAQKAMLSSIIMDVGSSKAAYSPKDRRAAVHHGDLLPLERRLTESVFRTRRNPDEPNHGLEVIAATSTISQGLNLPCDVVILAGTDRSVQDDPDGNPRSDLLPHEILNSLGRAGRAGYSATGLAIVVPAHPIRINPNDLKFTKNQKPLSIVFSDQDACEDVVDPIALLLDQVEASEGSSSPKIQAMIRRLSSVSNDGVTGFDSIAKRSLGYFVKKSLDEKKADAWLESRKIALQYAHTKLQDPPVLEWQKELAVRNGIPPEIIERLTSAIGQAPTSSTSTVAWVGWLLDLTIKSPIELSLFIRETSLQAVFGRAYTNRPDRETAALQIVQAIKELTGMWCSGSTLLEMESWLLLFIRKYEGAVKQQASKSSTAHRARRFAIRILPDLGFLCGLLDQVARRMELETGFAPPPVVEFLQQMVKAGDYDMHHNAFRLETISTSRVGAFNSFQEIKSKFTADPSKSIEEVREEVRTAIVGSLFDSLGDLDDE